MRFDTLFRPKSVSFCTFWSVRASSDFPIPWVFLREYLIFCEKVIFLEIGNSILACFHFWISIFPGIQKWKCYRISLLHPRNSIIFHRWHFSLGFSWGFGGPAEARCGAKSPNSHFLGATNVSKCDFLSSAGAGTRKTHTFWYGKVCRFALFRRSGRPPDLQNLKKS